MQSRNIEASIFGMATFANDRIQIQRRGIDNTCALWAMLKQRRWDQRSRIQTDRTGRNQVAASQGQKIWGAWTGSNKMYGHSGTLSASAQVVVRSADT